MAVYWAQFEPFGEHLLRFDTRIYLDDVDACHESDQVLGAVVAKNPGSARPSDPDSRELQPVLMSGGHLLPTVNGIVRKAYARAECTWPKRGYIQVFNLFYLRDKAAKRAWKTASQLTLLNCPKESIAIPWLWYAWGRMGSQLPNLSDRFKAVETVNRFYFDKLANEIASGHPPLTAFPKHPQGLAHEPVVAHLAKLLLTDAAVEM